MTGKITDLPLRQTKFHRPLLTSDLVQRPRLLDWLNRNIRRRLTLVSAPAGYGKSTLVSNWMESCKTHNTWLSLDESDNDLRGFLEHIVAGIRKLHPNACPGTMTLITAPTMPPVKVLATSIVNDLSAIESPFILVMDDYGFIHLPQIHELMGFLIQHAPENFHTVILTRRDPPLPLIPLRAGGEMTEVRQADLKFTVSETAVLLTNTVSGTINENSIIRLFELTEGWPTGLRFTALSLHNREDVEDFIREMSGSTRHVQDYLVSEVLSRQKPEIRKGLLKTSILERFCASLVDSFEEPDLDGQKFIDHLERSNLFCTSLDDDHEWFRYHHLFRDLLIRHLKLRYSAKEIRTLHHQTGTWFIQNGQFEDGIYHILQSGDPEAAGRIVAQNRHGIMSGEGWDRLRNLINMLPVQTVESEPELLLAQAWSMTGFVEMDRVLDEVEVLLGTLSRENATSDRLKCEFNTLRALQHLHLGHGQEALTCAQRAIEKLPPESFSEFGFATIIMVLAYQMMGKPETGRSIAYDGLEKKSFKNTTYHARMLAALCFNHWLEANLVQLSELGRQYLKMGQENRLPETINHGHYFLGICHFERNELTQAEEHLAAVVHNAPVINTLNFVHCAFALALVYDSLGQPAKAHETVDLVRSWALELQIPSLLDISGGLQAELFLRHGNIPEAGQWAKTFNPHPFYGGYRFYMPALTLAKVHLAIGTGDSLQMAKTFLASLEAFFTSTHNNVCLITVLAMQALLQNTQGDESAAFSALSSSVTLAEPGSFIRPFLDLGPDMADLLHRLIGRNGASNYVQNLLAAFENDKQTAIPDSADHTVTPTHPLTLSPSPESVLAPLTNRETHILDLLSKRMSNKEIAQRLFISPQTVKRHTANLYKKLDVSDRRQAVEKAGSLGILIEL